MAQHNSQRADIEIRKITRDERQAFARVTQYAFAQWTDEPPGEDRYGDLNLDESFAGFVNGELVATLKSVTFQQSVRGVLKPMGGLAAIASQPLHRRQGLVRQLIQASFEDMRAKGQVVSALYPFKANFYAKFGYVSTPGLLHVTVPINAFSHHLPYARQEDGWHYETTRAIDARAKLDTILYETAVPTYSGYVMDPDRSDAEHQHAFSDQLLLFAHHDEQAGRGRAEGVLRYVLVRDGGPRKFRIYDMQWRSLDARDRLLGYIALHADHAKTVFFQAAQGTQFTQWLHSNQWYYDTQVTASPMMIRIVDVVDALTNLPVAAEGALVCAITDDQCAWNTGTFRLAAQGGRLSITGADGPADVRFSIQGISALAYGALPVAEIAHRGWLTIISRVAYAHLERWFPECAIYNPYDF